MEHNILNVRREGEFYYPIYFEEDFAELSSGLKKKTWWAEGFVSYQIPMYSPCMEIRLKNTGVCGRICGCFCL